MTLKKTGAHVDLAPAVLIGGLISCAVTLPLSLPFAASGKDVFLLAILGIFQLGIPCVMMVRASAHLSAPEVALLGLLEVLMGPLWSWLGAGEVPAGSTLIGGAIVLAALVGAGFVTVRRQYKRAQPSDAPANANRDVNLDIGETVQVQAWSPDGTASVKYRGANWAVSCVPGAPLIAGPHRVVEVVGSRLVVCKL